MNVYPFDHDGSVDDSDEFELPGFANAVTITRFAPAAQTAPSGGAATLRIQDETGADPSNYIEATIADGEEVGTAATGTVAIAAGGTIYLRVVTANGAGFLRGHFEYTSAYGTTSLLCTIAQVKAYLRLTGATHDAVFTALAQGVSEKMIGYMRRHIVSDTYDEYHNGGGYAEALVLRECPISGTPTVTISGSAYTGFEQDDEAGILYYSSATDYLSRGYWPGGWRNIRVQYTAGYASVPVDLREAAIRQVAYEAKLSGIRGDHLGVPAETDPTGISKTIDQLDWAPGVRSVLDRYKRVA